MTTATKNDTKAPAISGEVLELAEQISSRLTMDKKVGTCSVPEKTFVELLPEGLTEEQAKSLQQYTMNMAAASLYAMGEAAIPVLKKNSELDKVSLSVPMIGDDTIELEINRSRDSHFKDAEGNAVTHTTFGHSSAKINTYGIGKRGDMKKVKEALAEQAQKAFGK